MQILIKSHRNSLKSQCTSKRNVQTCETAYKQKRTQRNKDRKSEREENKIIYQDKCYVIINILYAMYAQSPLRYTQRALLSVLGCE